MKAKTLEFDFYEDFRETPPPCTPGRLLVRPRDGKTHLRATGITITGGSTLTIESQVSIAGELVIQAGSRVVIAEGAELHLMEEGTLRMDLGARVIVDGTLVLNGLVRRHGNAVILVSEQGRLKNTSVGN